ncbi:hypothetical protein BDN71DRAFT_1428306 [Pleurotus eryngii]|uniref:Uncharacterized protein n=1 Tax=Pleurotus eryngii TaxID=5323 RepID=A0A9P6A5A4_PLEER|nr:hypothetical protein BDN71DRAFT_1428306 [Pleurotus eryngii]
MLRYGHINLEPIELGGSRDSAANDPYGFRKWNRHIRITHSAVLSWCNGFSGLTVWFYPVMNGARVPPSDLNWYCRNFDCHPPSCLCASQDPDFDTYTEASIFMVTSGSFSGEYVAACAQGQCHYWIFIEKLYSRRSLPIQEYEPHLLLPALPITSDVVTPQPSQSTQSTLSALQTQVLGRRRRGNNSDDNETLVGSPAKSARLISPSMVRRLRVIHSNQNSFKLLMCMHTHSVAKPGITKKQFKALFRRCATCNLFMTTRSFHIHDCDAGDEMAVHEVIDLTSDI